MATTSSKAEENKAVTANPSPIGGSPHPNAPTACAYRQAHLLQQALASDKMRVAFFLGAGCPVSIRVPDGTKTKPLIPNIEGLTDLIRQNVNASEYHKVSFSKILDLLDDTKSKQNIEHILTRVRNLVEAIGTKPFDGISQSQLIALDKKLCEEIHNVMDKRLPSKATPYHQLASWINSVPRSYEVEVFTSNYDLLMEQAFEESKVPYFDGFCGSDRTFFDSTAMEQDKLPPRWSRLWKVHGSINWWRTVDNEIQRKREGDDGELQMIHPSHLKYLQSRLMPYLAMQDRLRAFLAKPQAVLVTCGYSFADKHLTRAIMEGLRGNPTAVCFGLIFEDRATAAEAVAEAGTPGNLRLLGVDGGVLGTVDRDWNSVAKSDDDFHGKAVVTGNLGDRTKSPDDRCKFLLGDFQSLGQFLASELERRDYGVDDDNVK